jgi:hypothetical protein
MIPASPFYPTAEIAVDGSNALFGDGAATKPKLVNLKLVVRELKKAGWKPVVFVDASRKYDVDKPSKLRVMIKVGRVREVQARTPADYWILKYATEHRCRVLSNDRFADWAERFPIVNERDRFVRFRMHDGTVDFWSDADKQLPGQPRLERLIKPQAKKPRVRAEPMRPPAPRIPPRGRPGFYEKTFGIADVWFNAIATGFFVAMAFILVPPLMGQLGIAGVPLAIALAGVATCCLTDLRTRTFPWPILLAMILAGVVFYAWVGTHTSQYQIPLSWDTWALPSFGAVGAFFGLLVSTGALQARFGFAPNELPYAGGDVLLFVALCALLYPFAPPLTAAPMFGLHNFFLISLFLNTFVFMLPAAILIFAATKCGRSGFRKIAEILRERATNWRGWAAGLAAGAIAWGVFGAVVLKLDVGWWYRSAAAGIIMLVGAFAIFSNSGGRYVWGICGVGLLANLLSPVPLASGGVSILAFMILFFTLTWELAELVAAAIPEQAAGGIPLGPAFLGGLVVTVLVGDLLTLVAVKLCPALLALIGQV